MRFYCFWLCLYLMVDVFSTTVSLGLHGEHWQFSIGNIINVFNVLEYSFFSSKLEFVIMCAVRVISILFLAGFPHFCGLIDRKTFLWKAHVIFTVCYVFSLVKPLAFATDKTFEPLYGDIMIVLVSLFNSFYFCILSKKLFKARTSAYQILVNEEGSSEPEILEEADAQLENGAGPNVPGSMEQESDAWWNQICEVLKYCPEKKIWLTLIGFLNLFYSILDGFETKWVNELLQYLSSKDRTNEGIQLIVKITAVIGLKWVIIFSKKRSLARIKLVMKEEIVSKLHNSLTNRQEVLFLEEAGSGQLSARVTDDCVHITNSFLDSFEQLVSATFDSLSGTITMFYLDWHFATVNLLFIPTSVIVSSIAGDIIKEKSTQESDANAEVSGTVNEILSGIRTVRAFGAGDLEVRRFNLSIKKLSDLIWEKFSTQSLLSFFSLGWIELQYVAFLGYALYLRSQDMLNPATFFSCLYNMYKLSNASKTLSHVYSETMESVGKANEILKILKRKPGFDHLSGTEKPEIVGKITFENVSFSYPSKKNELVLKDFNLDIIAGKTCAFVGKSGCGKTTTTSLFMRHMKPTLGKILIDGVDIFQIEPKYYHQKVSIVSQEPTLFNGTIRQNICYGLENVPEEVFIEACRMANVDSFVEKWEKKYDTTIGEKGMKLSGGQKQRIAIARALVRNPRILILDEATSALDSHSEAVVQEAIERSSKNRTVICIAHRLSTIRNADVIAVFDDGAVAELGNHRELMERRGGLYRKFVLKQMGVSEDDDDEVMALV